jgi:hypothetical protein
MSPFLIIGMFLLQGTGGLTVESVHSLFSDVQSAAISPDQRLLVTDGERHAVLIVGAGQRIERTIGRKGWGNDSFDGPSDISATFLLEILVTDRMNERVQHFDKNMVYVRTYDRNTIDIDSPIRPVACVQSNQGEIFILDAEERRVLRTDSRGRLIGSFAVGNRPFVNPTDLIVSEEDKLFVLDGSVIYCFDPYGNLVRSIPLPDGIAWNSISLTRWLLFVTSPSTILVHEIGSGAERTIVSSDLVGVNIDKPFRAGILSGDILNIFTSTTLYRCTFPESSR